jgi:hypothetical protein
MRSIPDILPGSNQHWQCKDRRTPERPEITNGQYNAALSLFFVSYALAEPLTNILLKHLRPSIFLPIIMILWVLAFMPPSSSPQPLWPVHSVVCAPQRSLRCMALAVGTGGAGSSYLRVSPRSSSASRPIGWSTTSRTRPHFCRPWTAPACSSDCELTREFGRARVQNGVLLVGRQD